MPVDRFHEIFGREGSVFLAQAPGRVNLIGEHTDYNGGYVLPIAIDRSVRIAFRPTRSLRVEIVSLNYGGRETFDLNALARRDEPGWINYPMGVANALREAGHEVSGFEGVVQGDVPVGAGLSSSAAFEVAAILAFCSVSGVDLDRCEMARLCQRAEHTFAGVKCGIMDMYVSLYAEKDRAVLIDCARLTHELEPLDGSRAAIVVCDTRVKHELAQSEYNTRRSECESAFAKLRQRIPAAETYKDISLHQFNENSGVLSGKELMRARHVVTENQRVLDSVAALRAGDLAAFGRLMNASHDSLRCDYEVSCDELDLMVDLARKVEGVLGSRMTGGGFGGCAVSLVLPEAVDDFVRAVTSGYEAKTRIEPRVWVCEPAAGASVAQIA